MLLGWLAVEYTVVTQVAIEIDSVSVSLTLNDILWMIFAAPSERLDFKDTNFVGLNHSIPKHYGTRQQI